MTIGSFDTDWVALALNLAVATVITLLRGRRARADELDETREPARTVGAGVA